MEKEKTQAELLSEKLMLKKEHFSKAMSDDEIAKDHTWNRKHYPACPTAPYNYFSVNNALLDTKAQLESLLYNSFQMEEEIIMFRVVRGSLLEREINAEDHRAMIASFLDEVGDA